MLKQDEILRQLNEAIEKEKIDVVINIPWPNQRDRRQVVSLDVEHNESGEYVGCGLYSGSGPVYYYTNLLHLNSVPFYALDIIAHNGISDIECLQMWGIKIDDNQLIWDTMLIGHIIDSSKKDYSLKNMAKQELGITYPSYDDIVGKRGNKAERITLDKQPMELVARYNSLDVYSTWKLYERQHERIGIF